jgi:acyl-CoA thioester hydrolase
LRRGPADSGRSALHNARRMNTTAATTTAPNRSEYRVFRSMPTRWMDNDHYGHVNNVVYYSYFDTAVNGWLIDATGTDIRELPAIGLVVETSCRFHASLSFPDQLELGLAVEKLGRSSIVYRIGIFRQGESQPAATGRFVHVYVDRDTRATIEMPSLIRAAAQSLL